LVGKDGPEFVFVLVRVVLGVVLPLSRGLEVDAILDVMERRFEVARYLLEEEELDFVHVTLFYLNVLQHFFWNDEPTKRAWEMIDEQLGELAAMDDLNLVLMSDHGCGATTTEFYINEWLAENGYQAHERTVEDFFRPLGLTRENVLGVAKKAGVVDLLAKTVPESIQQLVPQSAGAKRARKLEAIDLSGTQAVASGQGPIYLMPGTPESVRDQLIEELYVGVGAGDDANDNARTYEALVANKPVVELDENVSRRAGVLEGEHLASDSKPTLGPNDSVVAATGLVYNEPVVTSDSDFERVDGLSVELY